MRINYQPKLDFKDVLIEPKVSFIDSRKNVELERTFQYHWQSFSCVPIIASNMDGVGTISMAHELAKFNCLTAITKHDSPRITDLVFEKRHFEVDPMKNIIYSIGMKEEDLAGAVKFFHNWGDIKDNPFMLCIDVANGYNQEFIEFVKVARSQLKHIFIIAGNVVTASQTENLIFAGANAVKVGIGSGSVCTTRKVTGVGYPQLSAIMECADAAHGLGGFIVADGGCQVPGDVAKAFAGGADFVMLGGMLAGHDESEFTMDGKAVEFYGSSSKKAQEIHNGGLANYRSSEGKCVRIPYRGPVKNTLDHILGGLRSTCTYVGASKLKDLSKRTTFNVVHNGQQYNTTFGDDSGVT